MEIGIRPFWHDLEKFGDSLAVVDEAAGRLWTYSELARETRLGSEKLKSKRKKLVWLAANNDFASLGCYLSCLQAGHAVCLWPGNAQQLFNADLLKIHQPDILLWRKTSDGSSHPASVEVTQTLFGYRCGILKQEHKKISSQLALLMPTSGSTGSPKLARLSSNNVAAAALQVAKILSLSAKERGITSLPMSFIYGLTVVNSHLQAGGSLILNSSTIYGSKFWEAVHKHKVTLIPAVPWTIGAIKNTGFTPSNFPSLSKILISGGSLSSELSEWLIELSAAGHISIFSMYGQTEACGRISVLAPSQFAAKPRSVGVAVPGGDISCDSTGQIIYRGPNVMLGYASSRSDLSKGDELRGKLPTGDVGAIDGDGLLHLSSRLNRICKLYGLRINLDEVEQAIVCTPPCAILEKDERLHVFYAGQEGGRPPDLPHLAKMLAIPAHIIDLHFIASMPRTNSGKIGYKILEAALISQDFSFSNRSLESEI